MLKGAGNGDGGVEHGELLVRLCEAMVGRDQQVLAEVRDEVRSAMGAEVLVDAVGVSALFHLMNRVTNGTGTPLDPMLAQLGPPAAAQFGADRYRSSHDTSVERAEAPVEHRLG